MGRAKEKPPVDRSPDYETDFAAWSLYQAELLRQRYDEVDLANVVEELESIGVEQELALAKSYRELVACLLVWVHQPEHRAQFWKSTIINERANINGRERMNESLRLRALDLVSEVYPKAVRLAATETGLPRSAFPAACPWTLDQLRDDDFLPE